MPNVSGPILSVNGIKKSYGERRVLDEISLEVMHGQCIVVIGPSGGGKSTLLRCIAGLELIDNGEIRIDGELVQPRVGRRHFVPNGLNRDLTAQRERQKSIGMIFQNFNLFPHMNVRDNVALALRKSRGLEPKVAFELADVELGKVGLGKHLDSYPDDLSGGQQQRVAIARAMVMRPEILLFDEPTSALDPELVGEVLSIMKQLAKEGMSMVVVTHEMSFARDVAQDLVFISDGIVVEAGSPRRVLESPEVDRTKRFLSRLLNH